MLSHRNEAPNNAMANDVGPTTLIDYTVDYDNQNVTGVAVFYVSGAEYANCIRVTFRKEDGVITDVGTPEQMANPMVPAALAGSSLSVAGVNGDLVLSFNGVDGQSIALNTQAFSWGAAWP